MLGEFLNSINVHKEDILERDGVQEKEYPLFPVARTLSYFPECIFLVNEINALGLKEHGITNSMHYSYLLNVIPKGRRFTKWTRPPKYEYIEYLKKEFQISTNKAIEYMDLYTLEELEQLKERYNEGGK